MKYLKEKEEGEREKTKAKGMRKLNCAQTRITKKLL